MGFSGGGELKDIFKIQCYVATWMGGELRGEWIHVYVWLSYSTILYMSHIVYVTHIQ